MYQIASFPGKYIQGNGAIMQLEGLLKQFGSSAIILTSPTARKFLPPEYEKPAYASWIRVEQFGGECSEEELQRLSDLIGQEKADVLVGMGGGKAIDTAKIAADRAGIPVIVVPTIASTDAPCSGCAVTYSAGGVFEKVHYQRLNPAVVLVDVDIIALAPVRFLVAGMGDALATWFEARSCAATSSVNECGGLSTLTGQHLARLCYDILMEHGLQAKLDNEAGIVSAALNHIVEANILLSGIGFESGGLAAAHAIHNGLTALDETHDFYHGEKVAFGLLAGLLMNGAPAVELKEVYGFCKAVGLPVTLPEIGVSAANKEGLMQVANKAIEQGSSIHHAGQGITAERVYNALLQADDYGRHYHEIATRKFLFPHEGYLDMAETRVWYRIKGRGDQIPLLLLHGGPGAPSYYLNPLGELASDRPVIFFDQPGCGRSGPVKDLSATDVNYFVDVVEQVARHLELKAFSLYGQSWGALLAMEYYLQHSERVVSMILSSPLISTPQWIQDTDALIGTLPEDTQKAIRLHEAAGSFDSEEYQQAMQVFYEHFLARRLPWPEDMLKTFEQMGLEVYNHMWGPSEFTCNGLLRNHDRSDCLKDIQVPVLYLCGEFDEARPETIGKFHQLTPASNMHVVQGAAHMTMHDAPDRDIAMIREFLGSMHSNSIRQIH